MSTVTLVEKFGSDLTVANAARVSYGKRITKFGPKDQGLLNYLAKHEHWSPFRHVYLQLHIRCPEFLARQLYKHIVGISVTANQSVPDHAWNEISGRYVELQDVYIPPEMSWRAKPGHSKQGSGKLVEDRQTQLKADLAYQQAVDACLAAYRFMLKSGIAPEQARMVLPVSFMTEFYWTASFQAIANVIRLRTAPDAQKEIRDLVAQIETMFKEAFPAAFEAFAQTS